MYYKSYATITIIIQGVHIYDKTFHSVKTKSHVILKPVGVDLNGANCSLTGDYESTLSDIYSIPYQSCIIGKLLLQSRLQE